MIEFDHICKSSHKYTFLEKMKVTVKQRNGFFLANTGTLYLEYGGWMPLDKWYKLAIYKPYITNLESKFRDEFSGQSLLTENSFSDET